jgi:RNA polymerase sigma-70 factor, ECF subfamily
MNYNNTNLLDLIRAGDKKAFDQLFRMHYISLRNYSFQITSDMTASEDIVQDLFFRLWTKHELTSKINSLEAYLRTSVYNRSVAFLKEKTRKNTMVSLNHFVDHENIHLEILQYRQDTISREELAEAFEKAVSKLPDQCRTVFKLSRSFGLKNSEIAEHLGISVKGVEKHMTKALQFLRDALKEFLTVLLLLI